MFVNQSDGTEGKDCKFYPYMSQYHPMTPSCPQAFMDQLPLLCYPDFTYADMLPPSSPMHTVSSTPILDQFVLTSTNEFGARRFIYCCRFINNNLKIKDVPPLPSVVCIVSPLQAHSFYISLVSQVAFLALDSKIQLREFWESAFWKRVPKPGDTLRIPCPRLAKEVVIFNEGERDMIGRRGLGRVIDQFGIEVSIEIFNALLCEKRILISADTVSLVCSAVQCFAALLYPFNWEHTLIPIIPDPLVEYCYSPAPYLIGILNSNLNRISDVILSEGGEEFLLVVDLHRGILKNKEYSNTDGLTLPAPIYNQLKSSLIKVFKPETTRRPYSRAISNSVFFSDDDSFDSDLDFECRRVFLTCLANLIGHYKSSLIKNDKGKFEFDKHLFINHPTVPKLTQAFLK